MYQWTYPVSGVSPASLFPRRRDGIRLRASLRAPVYLQSSVSYRFRHVNRFVTSGLLGSRSNWQSQFVCSCFGRRAELPIRQHHNVRRVTSGERSGHQKLRPIGRVEYLSRDFLVSAKLGAEPNIAEDQFNYAACLELLESSMACVLQLMRSKLQN
jgi:hypothetical protein